MDKIILENLDFEKQHGLGNDYEILKHLEAKGYYDWVSKSKFTMQHNRSGASCAQPGDV